MTAGADSAGQGLAGQGWAGQGLAGQGRPGRAFTANPFSSDDGTAPAGYPEAVAVLRASGRGAAAVLDVLRSARLLVPLVTDLAEAAAGQVGGDGDVPRHKQAELALPTVAGPDGRPVLPAFSSTTAMTLWRPGARPVPAPARQVALGAAADHTELVVIDPGSAAQFGLRRSAVEALARDSPWAPPWEDPDVLAAVRDVAAAQPEVDLARVSAGDPLCTLEQAELIVTLGVAPGGQEELRALLARIRDAWSVDPVVARSVDSFAVRLETAG